MKRMFYQVYVRDAEAAVDLYRRAFSAELLNRIAGADGAILHAEMDVFGQILALSESAEAGGGGDSGNTMQFCIQFDPDEAAIVKTAYQALEEGATIYHPLGRCFYSEYMADLTDRFGVRWLPVRVSGAATVLILNCIKMSEGKICPPKNSVLLAFGIFGRADQVETGHRATVFDEGEIRGGRVLDVVDVPGLPGGHAPHRASTQWCFRARSMFRRGWSWRLVLAQWAPPGSARLPPSLSYRRNRHAKQSKRRQSRMGECHWHSGKEASGGCERQYTQRRPE